MWNWWDSVIDTLEFRQKNTTTQQRTKQQTKNDNTHTKKKKKRFAHYMIQVIRHHTNKSIEESHNLKGPSGLNLMFSLALTMLIMSPFSFHQSLLI